MLCRCCLGKHMYLLEQLLPVVLLRSIQYLCTIEVCRVIGRLLFSDGNFQVFFKYNLLQWYFVCDFQCPTVGLLLSDKSGTWFPEFPFNVFYPYGQSAVFLSSLNIAYMRGCWTFPCLFQCTGKVGKVFDAQGLCLVYCCLIPEYAYQSPDIISVLLMLNATSEDWNCTWMSCRPL